MNKLDKTIKGLECCIRLIEVNDQRDDCSTVACPYDGTKECDKAGSPVPMMHDALDLLRRFKEWVERLEDDLK